MEVKIYDELKGNSGVPTVYYTGQQYNYNILVMELLGKNLDSVFEECKKKFNLKTILLLFDQMLDRIELLHEHGFVYRDIKPENFMFGNNDKKDILYLIDFGLSKRYRSQLTRQHIPYREESTLTGTARYCSINAHSGEQSRRDDLEAIGYLLVYFMKGSLPWQGLPRNHQIPQMKLIEQKKRSIPLEDLCRDLPDTFRQYIEYCRNLDFKSKPDYRYLKKLFHKLADSQNIVYDNIYDWTPSAEVQAKTQVYKSKATTKDNKPKSAADTCIY